MLTFEPDDVSSLFDLPIYDLNKLHVRILHEAKTVADALTSVCDYGSQNAMWSTKLECMIYAYSHCTSYLSLLLSNRRYGSDYNTIFQGFLLHSLNPALLPVFEKYRTSPSYICNERFSLYQDLFNKQGNQSIPLYYQFLSTVFYKQPLKPLRIYDTHDNDELQIAINQIIIQDDDLVSVFTPALNESIDYLEYKVELFCGAWQGES